jgi:hypothetical protein
MLVLPRVIGFLEWDVLAGHISLRGTSDHDTYAGRDVRTEWVGQKVEVVEEVEFEVVDDEGIGVEVAVAVQLLLFLA